MSSSIDEMTPIVFLHSLSQFIYQICIDRQAPISEFDRQRFQLIQGPTDLTNLPQCLAIWILLNGDVTQ